MLRSVLILALPLALGAQQLPEGPGRAETEKICRGCHELARSISPRQDCAGWLVTFNKMTAFGMKATEQEFNASLDYMAKQFPAEDVPKVNVNTATAIQLESALSLRRSQAAAVLAYRKANGNFSSIEDLKKVPGIEAEKIEARKDRITFQ